MQLLALLLTLCFLSYIIPCATERQIHTRDDLENLPVISVAHISLSLASVFLILTFSYFVISLSILSYTKFLTVRYVPFDVNLQSLPECPSRTRTNTLLLCDHKRNVMHKIVQAKVVKFIRMKIVTFLKVSSQTTSHMKKE